MINASSGSAPNQTTGNNPTTPLTPTPGPGFPTHNPAMQHKNLMPKTPSPAASTPPAPVANITGATAPATPKFPDPTKNLIKVVDQTTDKVPDGPGNKNDSTKPKKKLNLKLVLGVFLLVFILIGSGVGFYLSQQQQEIRQKAFDSGECRIDSDCLPWTTSGVQEYCVNNTCTTISPAALTAPVCGNGKVEQGEECDDGNDINDDECTNLCTLPATTKPTITPQISCNSTCTVGTEAFSSGVVYDPCTVANPDWVCYPETDTCRNSGNPTSLSCEGPVETPEPLTCGAICNPESFEDLCTKANENWICNVDTNTCTHQTNPDSATCEADDEPDSTSTPTPDPSASPSATPNIGCNEICVTNADCADTNHICTTTEDGTQKCRLDSYPTSTSCTLPAETTQPTLPPELPQSGPKDWLNWFKAGLVTAGLGAALFFLL